MNHTIKTSLEKPLTTVLVFLIFVIIFASSLLYSINYVIKKKYILLELKVL